MKEGLKKYNVFHMPVDFNSAQPTKVDSSLVPEIDETGALLFFRLNEDNVDEVYLGFAPGQWHTFVRI